MITGKPTSKSRTTIPEAVRTALGLRPGDKPVCAIENSHAALTRHNRHPEARDPFACFDEWNDATDARAYEGL